MAASRLNFVGQPGRVPTVEVFTTQEAPPGRLREIRRLLDDAFGRDFSDDDWGHTVGGRHVVVVEDGEVVSHAAAVARVLEVEGRSFATGYVEGVATARERQGEGLGSLAMAEIGNIVRGNFEMGGLSTDRHDFYGRLGWDRWRGPTFARHGADAVRTEDEDDGVMVLRFGPSSDVDLTAPISCESRPGDDW